MATIMVVDDTPGSREPIARLLRLEGYETVCASNGREALETMREQNPDLVLLDLMMPEMDGMTFLEHVRKDPDMSDTPVILMTAIDDRQTKERANRLGVDGYLVKARFTIGEMLDRIRQKVA
jgi:CheY-like chemotaxis protein